MNTKLKLLSSILAMSTLAACGGSDGDEPAPPPAPGPVSESAQWIAHETTFTGPAIADVSFAIASAVGAFIDSGMQPGTCDTGTYTGTYVDNGATGLSNDDSIQLDFVNCESEEHDVTLNGSITAFLGAITGDPTTDGTDYTVKMRLKFKDLDNTVPPLSVDTGTTLTGSIRLDIAHSANGTPADDGDDVDTVTVISDTGRPEVVLEATEEATTYSTTVTNYAATFKATYAPRLNTFSALEYSMVGTDTVQGDFAYSVKQASESIVIDPSTSRTTTGTFESTIAASAEVLTTTFSTEGEDTSVKIDSSLGTSSTASWNEYNDYVFADGEDTSSPGDQPPVPQPM